MPAARALTYLLDRIHEARGVDFSQHREAYLERRIQSRMQRTGRADYVAYWGLLESDAQEFDALFDALSINVTKFLRDPKVWACLEHCVIPAIMAQKGGRPRNRLRCWSAGTCAGQEAYSIAILLHEVLGERLYTCHPRIYGTDVNGARLEQANQGAYGHRDLERMSPQLVTRYFHREGAHYYVDDRLRLVTKFQQHDLITGKPLRHMDLLVCRNVLIYFTRPLQARLCSNFHQALNPGGFLVLGQSENLPQLIKDDFTVIDAASRIYQKR